MGEDLQMEEYAPSLSGLVFWGTPSKPDLIDDMGRPRNGVGSSFVQLCCRRQRPFIISKNLHDPSVAAGSTPPSLFGLTF